MKKVNGDEMRKALILGAVISAILIISMFFSNLGKEEYNWQEDQIILMQHETEGFYACFGCSVPKGSGPAMCIDPAPVMVFVEETEERYCNGDFEVVEKTKILK